MPESSDPVPAARPAAKTDATSGSFATVPGRQPRGHVGDAAEGGSGLSHRNATGMALMTETAAIDRRPVEKPSSRRRSRKPATLSASALAEHLDCSRTYVSKLEAEGAIQRQGNGFPLDQSRVAYLRYLGRERQQSPCTEADAAHAKAARVSIHSRASAVVRPV